jgi:5-methyltetrahydrofolate--homocysteine methyltransferase
MTEDKIITQYINAVVNMDIEMAKKICKEAIDSGIHPFKIIQEGITKSASIISDKFEAEEYFIPELIMAGEIIKETMKILDPKIKEKGDTNAIGKVIIGTGKGDLHDIGKNIVKTFLEAEGFEVIDLGVDVSSEAFIDAIRTEKPEILAISALVSMTLPEVGKLMKALEETNLRKDVKVIIGGAPVTEDFIKDIGADAYAKNAIDGISTCVRWVK